MAKMKSWDELKKLRADAGQPSDGRDNVVLAVGMATCGVAAGAREIMDALNDELQKQGLSNVSVVSTGCSGFCYAEPMVEVRVPDQPSVKYGYVTDDVARNIITKHVMRGEFIDNVIIGQEVQRP